MSGAVFNIIAGDEQLKKWIEMEQMKEKQKQKRFYNGSYKKIYDLCIKIKKYPVRFIKILLLFILWIIFIYILFLLIHLFCKL